LGAVNQKRRQEQKSAATNVAEAWFRNAKKWKWRERAEAWDEHERQKRLVIEQDEREKMVRRHVQIGIGLQSVGGQRLKQLESHLQELSPAEARLYLKEGIGLERTARGLPEYLLAVAEMSDEQLMEKYAELLAGGATGDGSDRSGDGGAGDGGPDDADRLSGLA